jgi:RimJ/RimL family protein N-acetyltransferase
MQMPNDHDRPWLDMTKSIPELQTARLILRTPRREDFPAWAEHMADPDVMQYLGGPSSPLSAWRNMTSVVGAWAIVGFSMFSVIEAASGRWIGRTGPWRPEGWPGNEIGWSFSKDVWGKGYATEAASASMDFAFERLGWEDCVHSIDSQNAPSIAVAERLGSSFKAVVSLPAPNDNEVNLYGQTVDQWRARRSGLSE